MATKKAAATKRTANTPGEPAKKTARKTSKTTTKKPADDTARKSPSKKTAAKRTANRTARTEARAARAEPPRRRSGLSIAADAARQVVELTGREVEGVTGVERTDDGWRVEVELLEVRRIPDTTDVLATYDVTVDEDGEIEGYRRLRRYVRGKTGEDGR